MTSKTFYTFKNGSIQQHTNLHKSSLKVFKDGSGPVSSLMNATQSQKCSGVSTN